jgi:hypothetical protein
MDTWSGMIIGIITGVCDTLHTRSGWIDYFTPEILASTKIKYKLTYKGCKLDNVHTSNSFDSIESFWKNWNVKHGETMKCVCDYRFKESR